MVDASHLLYKSSRAESPLDSPCYLLTEDNGQRLVHRANLTPCSTLEGSKEWYIPKMGVLTSVTNRLDTSVFQTVAHVEGFFCNGSHGNRQNSREPSEVVAIA